MSSTQDYPYATFLDIKFPALTVVDAGWPFHELLKLGDEPRHGL